MITEKPNCSVSYMVIGDQLAMIIRHDAGPSITILMTEEEFVKQILDARDKIAQIRRIPVHQLTSLENLLEPSGP